MASVARHFPILTFHELADDGAAISTSPALFERGMARLHGAGFRTLDLTSAADSIRRGEQFPDRHLSITFDDGYESVYKYAFPALRKHGLKATVFIVPGLRKNLPTLQSDFCKWTFMRNYLYEVD